MADYEIEINRVNFPRHGRDRFFADPPVRHVIANDRIRWDNRTNQAVTIFFPHTNLFVGVSVPTTVNIAANNQSAFFTVVASPANGNRPYAGYVAGSEIEGKSAPSIEVP